MRLDELVATSAQVTETPARLGKVAVLAGLLRRLRPDEVPVAVAYLSGELPHAPVGVGWASLRDPPAPTAAGTLELLDVDAALRRIGETSGPGSQAERRRLLTELLARATEPEQRFLRRLLTDELRQGALGGVMVDAVARASEVPTAAVRRALMLSGELGPVAAAALADGRDGLAAFRLVPLRPVQPMLAQTASDLADALARVGPASVEWKLDGARIQVHRVGNEVRAFTRNLADITERVPEVVEAVLALLVETVVLDGEAIALDHDGRPRPFQVTASRFGSRLDVERQRLSTPLSAFFFDVLHVDGEDVLDRPARERLATLADRVPGRLLVPRIEPGDAAEADRFLDETLERGHEGVMVKSLDAPVRGRPARRRVAQGQARAHPRPGRPGGRMGSRAPNREAQQPPSRRPRRRRPEAS